jgi:hypothetical protein
MRHKLETLAGLFESILTTVSIGFTGVVHSPAPVVKAKAPVMKEVYTGAYATGREAVVLLVLLY